jgi:hypothetical protein
LASGGNSDRWKHSVMVSNGASEKAARKTVQEKKDTRKSLNAKLYDTHKARAKAAGRVSRN